MPRAKCSKDAIRAAHAASGARCARSYKAYARCRASIATATSLARSTDGGSRWSPLGDAQGAQLVWTSHGLVRTVADGTVSSSADRGDSWHSVGHVPGATAKLTAGAEGALYAAMLDGTIEVSRDGGRSWKEVPAR